MIEVKFEMRHRAGVIFGILALFLSMSLFGGTPFILPGAVLSLLVVSAPYFLDILEERRRQKELVTRFPEFVRNLTGAIKSGIPASQAVVHVSETDYGSLSPYIKKLANQLEWGIPFHRAFVTFGRETNNHVIKRAIATVIQAEQAGGNMEDVLVSITTSLIEIRRIQEERKASIHSQIVQSYIIYFVFIAVMVVIQNVLIPFMSGFEIGSSVLGSIGGGEGSSLAPKVVINFSSPQALFVTLSDWVVSIHGIFLAMSVIQGLFAGIVLGKLAEGDLTSGLKHSAIFMIVAFMAMTVSQGFI